MTTALSTTPASKLRVAFVYLLMLVAAVLIFLAIRAYGESMAAGLPAAVPQAAGEARPAPRQADDLFHVLLALAVILATARLVGAAFRRIGQPPVIGEVVAGILLGPSLLGRLAPGAYECGIL